MSDLVRNEVLNLGSGGLGEKEGKNFVDYLDIGLQLSSN